MKIGRKTRSHQQDNGAPQKPKLHSLSPGLRRVVPVDDAGNYAKRGEAVKPRQPEEAGVQKRPKRRRQPRHVLKDWRNHLHTSNSCQALRCQHKSKEKEDTHTKTKKGHGGGDDSCGDLQQGQ